MSSVLRYHRLIADAAEEALRVSALNLTDYMLLMTLQPSETGTRLISQLARSLMVLATTATLATDRMEIRELLQRGLHPTDRHTILVTITDQGRQVAAATDALRPVEFGLMGTTVTDQRELTALLARLRLTAARIG
jgi:DNA-binding MarR family transcriptional regulator